MLNIPGHRAFTCEGPTRRELMRIGSIGLMGLSLPHFFAWQQQAKAAGASADVDVIGLQNCLEIWNSDRLRTKVQTDGLTDVHLNDLAALGI